jgi:uncharacterized Zn ribbon protein
MIRSLKWLLPVLALALVVGLTMPVLAADDPAGGTDTVKGKIQRVSADDHQFVLRDNNGRDWTFQVAREAKVRVNDKDSNLADLKQGDEVTINYQRMANEIRSNPRQQGADVTQGTIKSVAPNDNQLVLTDTNNKDWTFQLGENSRLRLADKDIKIGDLKQGEHATIFYTKQGDRLMANEVCSSREGQSAEVARGLIQRLSPNDNQFVLKDQNGKERAFQIARDAKVRVNDKDSNLADLKQGDEVTVMAQLMASDIRSERKEK